MGNVIHGGGGAAPIQILEALAEPRRRRVLFSVFGVANYMEVRNQATDASVQSFFIPGNSILEILSKDLANRAWWCYRGAAGAVGISWLEEFEEGYEPEIIPEPSEAPGMVKPEEKEERGWWLFKW